MREETDAIRAHYNADPRREWDRLMKKYPYEKYITVHIMNRYIQPGCSILDIGGGPGHYSIHYAGQGHPVTLLELEVVADNCRAMELYKSVGFVEYGRNPKGFLSRNSGWQENVLMRMEL